MSDTLRPVLTHRAFRMTTTPQVQSPREVLKQLAGKYPVLRNWQPLAIGIDKQLIALHPEFAPKHLRTALLIHTRALPYLRSVAKAKERFALDGSAAGEVTEQQRAHATEQIKEVQRKRAEARRQAEEAEKARKAEELRQQKLQMLVSKFSG